jgi:hypothetical protein
MQQGKDKQDTGTNADDSDPCLLWCQQRWELIGYHEQAKFHNASLAFLLLAEEAE